MTAQNIFNTLPPCCKTYVENFDKEKSSVTTRNYIYTLAKFSNFVKASPLNATYGKNALLYVKWNDIENFIKQNYVSGDSIMTQSARHALSVLSSFYKSMVAENKVDENPVLWGEYKKLITDMKISSPPQSKEPAQVDEIDQFELFIARGYSENARLSFDEKKFNMRNNARDIAILRLLYETHATAAMIKNLNLEDVDTKNNAVRYVTEEGAVWKEISDDTSQVLNIYITSHELNGRMLYAEEGDNALFISRKHKRIAERTIQYMIKNLSEKALVDKNKKLTPATIAKFQRQDESSPS